MHKILIVDDEEMILRMLKYHFEAEDYLVYTASNAEEALKKLSLSPDIILLDINMPELNGLQLCSMIREHINIPIIFLTARVKEQDKVNGLMAGGDDYITKPFSMEELTARITAHLRREQRSHNQTKTSFDRELIIDYGGHKIFIKNSELDLTNKEFEIISFMSMNAGQVFDRETLYERIWGLDGVGDSNVLKEHIRKIRTKFLQHTKEQYIETVWGVGYRWRK